MSSKCPSPPKGPPKPCIVTFHTQNDRMNEPPAQPKLRKITTAVNTLGVVVRNTETEIGVWVLTACKEQTIPKMNQHMLMSFRIGTWIIVGVYPDGTVATFSPWSLLLNAYETRFNYGCIQIKRLASELQHQKTITYSDVIEPNCFNSYSTPLFECDPQLTAEIYSIPGFGNVLGTCGNRQYYEDVKDCASIWVQYCGGVMKDCSWLIYSSDIFNVADPGEEKNDICDITEFIRNRLLENDIETCPSTSVCRHFGFVTDINNHEQSLHCWSPVAPMEVDHLAKIPPPPKHIECQTTPPLIGQWIQFDIHPEDKEGQLRTKSGYRLSIPEYLAMNSPCGIGIVHAYQTIRMAVSCSLVTGTGHPMVYEIPIFGFIVDRKSSLVSGSHVQLVLEKSTSRQQRSCGFYWRVINSCVVDFCDVTIEKIENVLVEIVSDKNAMAVSYFSPVEESPNMVTQSTSACLTSSGGTNQMNAERNHQYLIPSQQYQFYDPRHFIGNNIHTVNSFHSTSNTHISSKKSQQEDIMEGQALIEKITGNRGILWLFSRHTSVHFIFDCGDLHTGDFAYVKLEKAPDPSILNGCKWLMKSGTKISPLLPCIVENNQVYVEDLIMYQGIDNQQLNTYSSNIIPQIFDLDGVLQNPAIGTCYRALLYRRKGHISQSRYQWSICQIMNSLGTSGYVQSSNNFRQNFFANVAPIPTSTITEYTQGTSSSDYSSKSQPSNSVFLPSAN